MTGTHADAMLISDLGSVRRVRRDDVPIMYLDVAFDVEAIQEGWPAFESRFTSLRGRTMMAVVFPERGIYRLATAMRDEDDPDALDLDMGALPGGEYLLLRLDGPAPQVYRNIGPAFDELHRLAGRDRSRPAIELYRAPGQVECLLPVEPAEQVS